MISAMRKTSSFVNLFSNTENTGGKWSRCFPDDLKVVSKGGTMADCRKSLNRLLEAGKSDIFIVVIKLCLLSNENGINKGINCHHEEQGGESLLCTDCYDLIIS